MKIIDLAVEASEFCVRRTDVSLPKIKALVLEALEANTELEINWVNVKVLTPSYIDELIPGFILKFGEEKVKKLVKFNPQLTGFLSEQVIRGVKNRTSV